VTTIARPSSQLFNAAAQAYRGVIPAYMPPHELDNEITASVVFWGYEEDSMLLGVMGFQSVRDVNLIRNA
jgi:hypothetical protein